MSDHRHKIIILFSHTLLTPRTENNNEPNEINVSLQKLLLDKPSKNLTQKKTQFYISTAKYRNTVFAYIHLITPKGGCYAY